MNHMARPAEALEALEKAIHLDPRNRDRYIFQQGWAYTQLGRYEEAIPDFKLSSITRPRWTQKTPG
jgi:tetratricopeptide (TPR) repeat protein